MQATGRQLSLAAARRQPIGEHDGVDRASARSSDAFEMQGFFFKQAVKHAPGRAMTSATLQRQVHNFEHMGGLWRGALSDVRTVKRRTGAPRLVPSVDTA